jgi:DNA (cytosine-5)-methyltransferase 1
LDRNIDQLDERQLKLLKTRVDQRLSTIRESKFKMIDLFCGAGGLSVGLEAAGFTSLLGVDIEPDFCETYAHNHPHSNVFCGPIEKLTKRELQSRLGDEHIHLVAGGPPCQGFSTVGRGDPNDLRNSLFRHYCRIIKYLAPDYLLFENVTGILSKKNEKTLTSICQKFNSLGYEVEIKVLEAQHYGVPQRRKRAFILGHRKGVAPVTFPAPTHDYWEGENYIPAITVGDALKDITADDGAIYNHQLDSTKVNQLTADRLKAIPEGKGIRYKKDEQAYFSKKLKLNVDWEMMREGRLREQHYHRLDRKLPSPTLMTSVPHYYHPTEIRRFTVRECARFQSFPNDYIFCGSRRSQIKQVGNAVPSKLAWAIGEEFVRALSVKSKRAAKLTVKPVETERMIAKVRERAFAY